MYDLIQKPRRFPIASTYTNNRGNIFIMEKVRMASLKETLESKITMFKVVPECLGYPFDVSRIFPVRQRDICNIYDTLAADSSVVSAWVFGSSSNASCLPKSDIDMAVKLKNQSIQEWSRVCQLIRSAAPDYEYDFVDIDDVRPYSELHESIAKGVRLL